MMLSIPSHRIPWGAAFRGRIGWYLLALLLFGGTLLTGGAAPDWRTNTFSRWFPVAPESTRPVGFTRLASATSGLNFTNLLAAERSLTNQIFLNGSGVACGDVNGDGWCDILLAGLDSPNALFLNRGHWRFERQADSGLEWPGLTTTGVALADLDGDGDLDAVINTVGGGTWILFNDGHGRFAARPDSPPLNPARAGMSLALADFDGDGDLDLYVVNYRVATYRDDPNTRFTYGYDENRQPVLKSVNGVPVSDPSLQGRFTSMVTRDGRLERIENGEPDAWYLNDGAGGFTAISWTDGTFLTEEGLPLTEPPYDWGLGVVVTDLNGDRRPDLVVCNDFMSPDRWWLNQGVVEGKLRFRAVPRLAVRHTSYFSMGADVADVNRDGWDDIFVADMRSREHARRMVDIGVTRPEVPPVGVLDARPQFFHNTLQINRGDGTFAEVAEWAGVDASEWSWTPAFLDVDLDGYEDLLITTGHERDLQHSDLVAEAEAKAAGRNLPLSALVESRRRLPRLARHNIAYRNCGDLRFTDASQAWGFDALGVSHGLAFGDFDNDGDLDVVVNRLNEEALLYRNEAPAPRILVRLRGRSPNTQGIGARVTLRGGPVLQSQTVRAGAHYLSSDEPACLLAAGTVGREFELIVNWSGGSVTVVSNLPPNVVCEVFESASIPTTPDPELAVSPLFEDRSNRLNHVHWENTFDDFQRQPLLSRKYSQEGPGVAWADLDGDGRDDLVIGAGRGGRWAALRNRPDGSFQPWSDWQAPESGSDLLGVVALPAADGTVRVIAGISYWEEEPAQRAAAWEWSLGQTGPREILTELPDGCGPLALGDLDGNGSLVLFAGGRSPGGRFPEGSDSALYRSVDGHWVLDATNSACLRGIGRVNGACFSDLDGDGRPELVLACEWGPVRVFDTRDGALRDATVQWGLERWTGLWRGVASGDFDEDGRPDLIVSNWGLNTEFRPSLDHPRELFFGDWGGVGAVQSLEARWDSGMGARVPLLRLDALAAGLPQVRERFPNHTAYSRATLSEILENTRTTMLPAVTFATRLLLNRGDHFEVRALPDAAQWAVASAVVVADFDGDGHEDVFLGQNFFPVRPEGTRSDAGQGLLLKGDGRGAFTALTGRESGLRIWGDQRGAAAGDYDGDGRVDLVVTQNGAATKLYHNATGRPGLRVRLQGPPGNPTGIGAAVRGRRGATAGPWREVQAGSGYLGQNSPVRIVTLDAESVEVRWPGGTLQRLPVPEGTRELRVEFTGRREPPP